MAKTAKKVIAVEIDKTLIPILKETLIDFNNIEIINEDILKIDILKIINKYKDSNVKIVANLPYYITTPIIINILKKNIPLESITVMIQKEVAYRMGAKVGTKDYGALSLITQYFCKPYIAANVPKNCFIPRPNVDSAIINLFILKKREVLVNNLDLMFDIIKIAFSKRRKTLLNCIHSSTQFDFDKQKIKEILNKVGFSENIRGESLSLKEFAMLSDILEEFL